MITLITGPQGSGKSTKARKILENKSFFEYEEGIFSPYKQTLSCLRMRKLKKKIQYVLVQNVNKQETVDLVQSKALQFPHVNFIITSSTLKKLDLNQPETEIISIEAPKN